jgi:hypothetical protein
MPTWNSDPDTDPDPDFCYESQASEADPGED